MVCQNTRSNHIFLFSMSMLAFFLLIIIIPSPNAEAQGKEHIIVYIKFHEANSFIDANQHKSTNATLHGEIIVSGDTGAERIDLNLDVNTDTEGFLASVFPMQIMITRPFIGYEITLEVTIPPKANYTDGITNPPVQVTVSGDWLSYPSGNTGRVANSSVMLNINQYYGVSAIVEPSEGKCSSGESVTFTLWILNEGNCVDSFEVSIRNTGYYTDMGFSFFAEYWQIDVGPNMEGCIRIRIDAPKLYSGSNHIEVIIESKGSKMWESSINPVSTFVTLNLTVESGPLGKVIEPIINAGNYVFERPPLLVTIIVLITFILVAFFYSRIKRKALLDHAFRRKIYDYIETNPGIHYRELQRGVELKSGTLAHHLNVLEENEFIKSVQDGRYRRFFLIDEKPPLKFTLSKVQERIMTIIRDHPGITVSDISSEVGTNRMVVNYHARILQDAGLISLERDGRSNHCYPSSSQIRH